MTPYGTPAVNLPDLPPDIARAWIYQLVQQNRLTGASLCVPAHVCGVFLAGKRPIHAGYKDDLRNWSLRVDLSSYWQATPKTLWLGGKIANHITLRDGVVYVTPLYIQYEALACFCAFVLHQTAGLFDQFLHLKKVQVENPALYEPIHERLDLFESRRITLSCHTVMDEEMLTTDIRQAYDTLMTHKELKINRNSYIPLYEMMTLFTHIAIRLRVYLEQAYGFKPC